MRSEPETRGFDERGVSPVVGVALLIAITVILAAVIGFVVLNTSTQTTQAKNAQLDFNKLNSTQVEASHQGGDEFNVTNLVVKVNGTTTSNFAVRGDSTYSTGDDLVINGTGSGATITVIWDDPDSDRSVQIGEKEVE